MNPQEQYDAEGTPLDVDEACMWEDDEAYAGMVRDAERGAGADDGLSGMLVTRMRGTWRVLCIHTRRGILASTAGRWIALRRGTSSGAVASICIHPLVEIPFGTSSDSPGFPFMSLSQQALVLPAAEYVC